jgi:hypothetical protein
MTASLNPYISQFAEEFDAEKSSQYRMAIQFSLGGLSFAILDVTTETLIALECYQSELLADSNDLFRTLERAMENKGLNNKELLSVTCLIDNRYCALIPEPVFSETDQTKYLDFAFQIPANYSIESERLENAQCFNVYALLTAIKEKVLMKWPNARITHSNCLFINSMMQDAENDGVFVNVRNRDFDLLIKRNGKLQFFNNFKFTTKEDFAYFLLFALEQNNVSGQDALVRFSGLIRPASDIIDLCGRYVRDIRFVEDPHTIKVSNALVEVPFQYYYIHYQALR